MRWKMASVWMEQESMVWYGRHESSATFSCPGDQLHCHGQQREMLKKWIHLLLKLFFSNFAKSMGHDWPSVYSREFNNQ